MSLYDTTCFETGGFFGVIDCINVASEGILINILLIVLAMVTAAIFLGSGRSVKNVVLLSTTITAIASLFLVLAAGAAGLGTTSMVLYTQPMFVWFVLFIVSLVWHYLSDL